MRIFLFIILFFTYCRCYSQTTWQNVLNKSLSFYLDKRKGEVKFSTIEKNVLKNDTNYYFQTFFYFSDSFKLGRISYADSMGFSIYVGMRTYYVYPETHSYYIGENSSYGHLKFLPYWDPFSFFLKYFATGQKYGVKLMNEGRNYKLVFADDERQEFVLYIDSSKNNLVRYIEIYTEKELGQQYTEYIFEEDDEEVSRDTILNDLNFVSKNYVLTTDEMLAEKERQYQLKKQEVIGQKISMKELNRSLFKENTDTCNNCYVLLDYYFQSCLPCIKTIAELNDLQNRFHISKLKVIGIDTNPADVGHKKSFVERYKIMYPLIDGDQAVAIKNVSISDLGLSIMGYPTMVLIAPDGTVEKFMEGYSSDYFNELSKFLSEHIK